MSRASASPSLRQQPGPADPPPELTRLANRIALLTFVAAFLTVLGLALLPRAFAGGSPLVRLAAALTMVATSAVILYVRSLRAELRRVRQRGATAAPPLARSPSAPGDTEAGAAPRQPPAIPGGRRSPPEVSHGVER